MFDFVDSILYFIIFIVGMCIVSFINLIVYRVPKKISVFSRITFRGIFNNFDFKTNIRFILIEIIGGALSVLSVAFYGFSSLAIIVFVTTIILTAIAFIDMENMTIPNSLIFALIIPAVLLIIFMPDVSIENRIIGFFCISIPMLVLSAIIKGAFGGGDIKLVAVCGIILGWKNIISATIIAILMAGLFVIWLLISKRTDRKAHFAFGPFLSLGIIIALFLNNQ